MSSTRAEISVLFSLCHHQHCACFTVGAGTWVLLTPPPIHPQVVSPRLSPTAIFVLRAAPLGFLACGPFLSRGPARAAHQLPTCSSRPPCLPNEILVSHPPFRDPDPCSSPSCPLLWQQTQLLANPQILLELSYIHPDICEFPSSWRFTLLPLPAHCPARPGLKGGTRFVKLSPPP